MPKTETQIYESFVIAIILRKLRLDDPYIQLHSLKDLEGVDKECFSLICSLAYKMTTECKQIVHELPMSFDSLNSSPFRGLLTIDRTAKLFGLEDVVTFLHFTLQEYLAAYHLAGRNKNQQMMMIRSHRGKNHMLTTFKFYCRLVNMKQKMSQFDEITNVPDLLYTFHCAYETQEQFVCYRAIQLQRGDITLRYGVLTPADFTVLGYVISNASFLVSNVDIPHCLLYEDYTDDKWKNREVDSTDPLSYSFESAVARHFINMKICIEDLCSTRISYNSKPQYMQVLKKFGELSEGLLYDFQGYRGARKEFLDCSSDIFSSDSALPLADALKQCFNLKFLNLMGKYWSTKTASAIANIFKSCRLQLQEFKLYSAMPSSGAVPLVDGLRSCKHLHTLFLNNVDLCSDGAVTLAKGLTHFNCLKQLSLKFCGISPEGAEAIAVGLIDIPLETIHIPSNNIGCKGALALGKEFHFKELDCNSNNIGSDGTKALARGLMKSSILIELRLDDNSCDSSGITALAEGLSYCTGLQLLSLSHNSVGPDGAAALAQGIKSCTHLQVLLLNNCSLSSDGIVALALYFTCWRKLRVLDLSDNGIILDGTAAVIGGGLQFLGFLEQLYLSNSTIDSSIVIALAEGIQCCPLLHTLDISRNHIGSDGAVALAVGLKCKEMKYVSLSHNNIDVESVEALATLVQSSHLQRLDISHNNISSTGALCLISDLLSYVHPTRLNLQVNNISPKATKFLTTMLRRNSNLRGLL